MTQIRKMRRLQISARAKHRLGAVQPDGFDPNSYLFGTRIADLDLIDPQLLRPTVLMKANHFTHWVFLNPLTV
jgi:hypothetical protein